MATAITLITADELFQMSGNGARRELINGELRNIAPAGAEHGGIIANFAYLLTAHVKSHKLGRVLGAETGFCLTHNPDTVYGADVAFIRADRIPSEGLPKKFWEGAPDLAVEVVSPSDVLSEVDDKVDAYLAAGSRIVLIINPRRRHVVVHRQNFKSGIVAMGEDLDLSEAVPGFRCRVDQIFE